MSKYPKLIELKNAFDSKFISYPEIRILTRMFDELNETGLKYIERETQRMIETLRRKCSNLEAK